MPNRPRSGLNSGLDVLEALRAKGSVTLTDLARYLSMSKAGVHGILAILTERDYVERTPTGAYRLGVRAWELGGQSAVSDLRDHAAPVMERLVGVVEEGCILGTLTGFEVAYLHLVESKLPVRVNADVGARIPANCTSTGLALLSSLTDDQIRTVLPRKLEPLTPATIVEPDELLREVARTRARGYAVNRGGWRIDVGGIAVVVRGRSGIAAAGLCVAAPLYRMNRAWFDKVVPATRSAAQAITNALGGRPSDRRVGL
jgi:IclR family transcriptional regulator, KDG regulon repressor